MLGHHHRNGLTVNITLQSKRHMITFRLGVSGEFYVAGSSTVTRRRAFERLVLGSVNWLKEAGG